MSRWMATCRRGVLGLALLWGCGEPGPDGSNGLAPLPDMPGFAVLLTDYTSTAVAMLDADGEVLDGRWVHSGTAAPGLVTALSGDVAFPTRQADLHSLTLLDRMNTDVITRFEVPGGALIGQVRTHGPLEASGFSSNPQDVVFLSPDRAWVSRMGINLDPAASPRTRATISSRSIHRRWSGRAHASTSPGSTWRPSRPTGGTPSPPTPDRRAPFESGTSSSWACRASAPISRPPAPA
jgi:hypothetical protein